MRTQFGKRILDSDLCVLCGVKQATTKEHIPPKALFEILPKEYLLVPACEKCNNSTKLEDEYLTQVMSGASLVGQGVDVWRKKIKPKFKDFPKTRIGLRNQLTMASIKIDSDRTIQLPAMKLNRKRIEKSIKKMIWGLYWFHTGEILPKKTKLRINHIDVVNGPNYFKDPENKMFFDQTILGLYQEPKIRNTFFYTLGISKELSLWYFFFYKQNTFIATAHTPED